MSEAIITLRGHGPNGAWTMEVVNETPICTLCERDHDLVAFVLHSGAPVCSTCVEKYAQRLHVHPLTDAEFAEACAREDIANIKVMTGAPEVEAPGTQLIVDGSQYAPSWRTMSGGGRVYDLTEVECHMVYEETLDEFTEAAGMHWEDGCLWWSS